MVTCTCRYPFVIHAGIDGFSRLPVYCKCSTNNRASTVLQCFEQAIARYGVPSRARSDKGGENVDVSLFMLQYRGTGRGSMITGRSVHNQRVERFWRDLFEGCSFLFYFLFRNLEVTGVDLFCLQYIYTARINRSLQLFCDGYSRHTIGTAGNQSPLQLWIGGMLKQDS